MTAPGACPNCFAALDAPPPRFCPHCGQETRVRPPTLGEFVQQFGGAYFATEGALWRTLRLLLTRPGELTRQYLAGRRRHYVLPLRLYLSISLVVLLLVRVVGSDAVQVNLGSETVQPPDKQAVKLVMLGGRAGLRDGRFYCEDLPGWLCKRLQRRIDIEPRRMADEAAALGERFLANIGGAMFLLLPGFALGLKLAYLNRRLRYTEHLVFALHLHAFWFIVLALLLLLPGPAWLGGLAFAVVPLYTLMAMRRVYGGRLWPRLLRMLFIGALHTCTVAVALVAVGLWALLA